MTRVEELTGFPECLEGRVMTLHPMVHAGLLADTRKPDHLAQLEDLGVAPFDLVVVNLYPFRETVASGASQDQVVENIDIGGPSMVRAAAKNHPSVAVVVDPAAYPSVLAAVHGGGFTFEQRKLLAAQAFVHTADYDTAVASWMGNAYVDTSEGTGFPAWMGATWTKVGTLRYGENPHQRAGLYTSWRDGVANAEVLHGKEMSYNNYIDADAAVRASLDHLDQPTPTRSRRSSRRRTGAWSSSPPLWRRPGTGSRSVRSPVACSCSWSTGSTPSRPTRPGRSPAATTPPTGGSWPVRPRTTRRWPTCSSRGGRCAR